MKADILIRNGRVIDPSLQLNGNYDIAIADGKIMAIHDPGQNATPCPADFVLDASGCVVTPGLIDLHTHVFPEKTPLGIPADQVGVAQGVTTVVDAGSSGAYNFSAFLSECVEPAKTQVLAFLNISGDGLCNGLSELADMSRLAPKEARQLIRQHLQIRGIKVRMSASVVKENGIRPLVVAKQLAVDVNLPLMVHIGNSPPALSEVLNVLDKGDVVTHAFHGKRGGILDSGGELIPAAKAALAKGVLFDVGHGTSSFSFATMRKARQIGVHPFTISTDIYRQNVQGPVHSLLTTMSKCLALGISLEEVIAATTIAPATILGLADEIGTLRPQTVADLTILKLENETVTLTDSEAQQIVFDHNLKLHGTIRAGKVMNCQ